MFNIVKSPGLAAYICSLLADCNEQAKRTAISRELSLQHAGHPTFISSSPAHAKRKEPEREGK
jgi:hypothetical protein